MPNADGKCRVRNNEKTQPSLGHSWGSGRADVMSRIKQIFISMENLPVTPSELQNVATFEQILGTDVTLKRALIGEQSEAVDTEGGGLVRANPLSAITFRTLPWLSSSDAGMNLTNNRKQTTAITQHRDIRHTQSALALCPKLRHRSTL